jgi:nitroimidazol reductase NimA-like FMN-containing flavoprotein (pyridoxamine 5'-phosphate oxidase superfamily)
MPELVEMDPDECQRLLRRGTVGRVALVTPRGPEIVPVNYTVLDDAVVVRTTRDGFLARHADGRAVAFEVDLLDHERWQGWSVVARGVGEVVHDPERGAPDRLRLRPWADGDRSSELWLAWTELTGRRLGSALLR